MAEPETHPMDDEDLEDGEIETDEENDVVINEVKPPPKVEIASSIDIDHAKKLKSSEDDVKKIADVKAKCDNRKSSAQDNSTKSKKSTTSDITKGKSIFKHDLII